MSWLWWGLATWLATDVAAAAWWAWHRSSEKRAKAIREQLEEIGRLEAREAQIKRDVARAAATRRRLTDAALRTTIPQQRRTEENQ